MKKSYNLDQSLRKLSRSGALTLFALFFCTFLVFILSDREFEATPSSLLILVNAALLPILISLHSDNGPVRCSLVHLIAVWAVLVIAPLATTLTQTTYELDFFHYTFSETDLFWSHVAVSVWVLVFYFSYQAFWKRLSAREGASIAPPPLTMTKFGLFLQLGVAMVTLVYIASEVGVGVLTRRGFEAVRDFDRASDFLFANSFSRGASVVALVALVLFAQKAKLRSLERKIYGVMAFALAIAILIINNPLAAARSLAGTMIIGVMFALWLRHSPKGNGFVLIVLAGLFLAFPIDFGRVELEFSDALASTEFSLAKSFTSDTFRAFEAIPASIVHNDVAGPAYLVQLIGNLLFFIPRELWETKPFGTGTTLAIYFGVPFTNVACPLQCEAIYNLGALGIPAFALAFAYLLARLDHWHLKSASRTEGAGISAAEIMYPFTLGGVFFVTRGDLLSPLASTLVFLLSGGLMVLAAYLSKIFSRNRTGKLHTIAP